MIWSPSGRAHSAQKKSDAAKYRVGVVGCGAIGMRHVSGLVGLDYVELVAGCDLNVETRRAFAAQWGDAWPEIVLYEDYRQMLADERLDVVTIATPDHFHAEPVIAAVDAGVKAIFCEKPMATSLADADRMRAALDAHGVIFSVDHTRRWLPLWRHIKERVIGGGQIGEVQYITGTLSGERAALFRNGTHLVDALCYLADAEPQWVFAELEDGYEDYAEYGGDGGATPALEPSASGYIHFKNGVRGFYTGTSKQTAGPKWRFEVVGSAGRILIDKEARLLAGDQEQLIEVPAAEFSGIPAGVRELVEALLTDGQTSAPLPTAMNAMEIIFGFLESQRRGNVRVDLPLERVKSD